MESNNRKKEDKEKEVSKNQLDCRKGKDPPSRKVQSPEQQKGGGTEYPGIHRKKTMSCTSEEMSPRSVYDDKSDCGSELSGGYASDRANSPPHPMPLTKEQKEKRAECLWRRHDKRQNTNNCEGKISWRVFWKKQYYNTRDTYNCHYCLSGYKPCSEHQVDVSNSWLEMLLKSEDPVLIP